MKKLIVGIIVCSMTLMLTGDTTAAMYHWVDENGVVHISDSPPPKTGSDVKTYRGGSESTSRTRPLNGNTKYGEKINSNVELYTTSWCPYCKKAKSFLHSRGISFTEYDIEKDKTAARRKNRLDSRNGVPFAIINGQSIHGFSEATYEKALGARR